MSGEVIWEHVESEVAFFEVKFKKEGKSHFTTVHYIIRSG